jgi:dipeptide/tripeptide permease
MPSLFWQMIYVIGIVEMCERFAYYGTTAVCTYVPKTLLRMLDIY